MPLDTPQQEESSESGDFSNVDLTNQLGTGSASLRLIASPRNQPGVNHGEFIGAEDNATSVSRPALSNVDARVWDLIEKNS